jgi:hypothetical protein
VVFDRERVMKHGVRAVLADVVSEGISTHHSPEKLARVVMKKVYKRSN